jgi:predicted phosphodiesterase
MRKILLVCILIMLGTLGRTAPAYAVIDPYLVFVSETEITIRWATSPVKYAGTVNYGITSSFTHSETEAGGNEFHTITLTGLRPNTLYYYEATGNGDTSGICSFRTAPPPDSGFTFLAYGDTRRTGSGPGFHTEHEKVIHSMLKHNPQTLILHTGDFTYDGSIDEWVPTLLQPGRDIYKNNVFYGSIGNHCYDRRNDVGSYQHLFSRSADPNAPDSELYYSFDYGNVHFVALDLNWNDGVDYSVGTTQYNWLKKDLESEAAKRATWIVVFGHYPAYTTGNHGNDNDIRAIRGSLVPLFENTGVDIYICGHDHIYERSYKNGVHYLVTGGGGAPLRKINVVADPYREYGMNPTGYNHCLIEAGTDTMTVKAFDVAGSMFDIFSVPKRQVIDAFTRQGIPGVSVTLHTGDGRVYEGCPQPNPQITKADGSYYFQGGYVLPRCFERGV